MPRGGNHKLRVMKVAVRRQKIERLVLSGVTNVADIAAHLGEKAETVRNDYAHLRRQWREARPEEAEAACDLRKKQLENIIRMCTDSYNISKKPKVITTRRPCENKNCKHGLVKNAETNKQEECPVCKGDGTLDTVQEMTGQAGDVKFLTLAKDCIVECAKMEGITTGQHGGSLSIRRTVERTFEENSPIRKEVETIFIDASEDDLIQILSYMDKARIRGIEEKNKKILTVDAKAVESNGGEQSAA